MLVKLANDPSGQQGIDPNAIQQGDRLFFPRKLNGPGQFWLLPAVPLSQDPGIVEFIVH